MRIINNQQLIQAAGPLDFLSAMEKAFLVQETGDFLMPDRIHAGYRGNVLLLMPAFYQKYFGTKLVSVFPDNHQNGENIITGVMVLNDGTTGKPLAILDATGLTAFRTAAVGALGIAYTTPKNVTSLGLIGAGTQGFHQALFACVIRNINKLAVYDPYHPDLPAFVEKLHKNLPHVALSVKKDAPSLVQESEVIITATTSLRPVIPEDADMQGKHFIGIGSYKPEMREFPDTLYENLENLVIDTEQARTESGDVRIPLRNNLISNENVIRLGQLINGSKQLDVSGTTFFKTVGMALFDLMAAQMVYEKATEKGLGTIVNF